MNPDKAFFQPIDDESLPIFTADAEGLTLFYAPGYLAAAGKKDAAEIRDILSGEFPFGNLIAADLISAASSACSLWSLIHSPDRYEPTCLTVYSSLACNLNCSYCFAGWTREPIRLEKDLLVEPARRVLAFCRAKEEPFTAVFHGGGEPSLDPRLPEILDELRQLCRTAGVPLQSYIATNGIMDEEKARWIAENIDEIGLSADGPPEIQNRQRPLRGGRETSRILERTAEIFRRVKGHLTVRATVLPENFSRMTEIAAYLCETLGADEIHMEPVYERGSHRDAELADVFCDNFLQTRKILQDRGARLTFSGSRITEIHGRYCQIFRQVLHLIPPDGISACFALSSRDEAGRNGLLLDWEEKEALFDRLSAEDPLCRECFNRFHCARGCPDVCPALPAGPRDAGSFRCRISRNLAEAELLETARACLFETARLYGSAGMELRGI